MGFRHSKHRCSNLEERHDRMLLWYGDFKRDGINNTVALVRIKRYMALIVTSLRMGGGGIKNRSLSMFQK